MYFSAYEISRISGYQRYQRKTQFHNNSYLTSKQTIKMELSKFRYVLLCFNVSSGKCSMLLPKSRSRIKERDLISNCSVHRPRPLAIPPASVLPVRGCQNGRHSGGGRIRVRNRQPLVIHIQVRLKDDFCEMTTSSTGPRLHFFFDRLENIILQS